MSAVRVRDYHVRFIHETEIRNTAMELRSFAGVSDSKSVDAISLIEDHLHDFLYLRNRRLHVILKDLPDEKPAFVKYSDDDTLNVTNVYMYIDKEIWNLARYDPRANFILCHEIAHSILHNNEAKAFHCSEQTYARVESEHSAEDHADMFADYLLLTDKMIAEHCNERILVDNFRLPSEVVQRRFEQARRTRSTRAFFETGVVDRYITQRRMEGVSLLPSQELCPDCGSFTPQTDAQRCSTCGVMK